MYMYVPNWFPVILCIDKFFLPQLRAHVDVLKKAVRDEQGRYAALEVCRYSTAAFEALWHCVFSSNYFLYQKMW